MPTPVGHTLTAFAAWTARRPMGRSMLFSPWLWLAVLSASAPDLDFIPGLLAGDESIFHRSAGHSVGGAAIYSAVIFVTALIVTGSRRTASAASAIGFSLFVSHLLLDLLNHDPGPPYGIQLFWPLSDGYHLSSLTVLPHLDRHPFDLSLLPRALPVIAWETLVSLPLIIAAEVYRRLRGPFP